MENDHFRSLERMYHEAPINAFYKPKLTVERGKSDLKIAVRPEFYHAAQAIHGSVYFKALDDAAFFAVNSLVEDVFVLTANFTLYFLHPVQQGILHAHGEIKYESASVFIAEATLYDGQGQQISRGGGTFIRSKILLTPEVGYQ